MTYDWEERKRPEGYRLHDPRALSFGDYYACTQPEKPDTVHTVWDEWCRPCLLHLKATYINHGGEDFVCREQQFGDPQHDQYASSILAQFLDG